MTERLDSLIGKYLNRVEARTSATSASRYVQDLWSWRNWCKTEEIDWGAAEYKNADDYVVELLSNGRVPNPDPEDEEDEDDDEEKEEVDHDEGLDEWTVSESITALSAFYDWLWDRGAIDNDPWLRIQPKEYRNRRWDVPRIEAESGEGVRRLNEDEIELILENVPKPVTRNRLCIRIMYATGIRQGEIEEIRLRDVSPEERRIFIRPFKSSDEPRNVYYPRSMVSILRRWMDSRRHVFASAGDSNRLIVSRKSGKMSTDTLGDMIHTAAENAGIQEQIYTDAAGRDRYRVTPHIFRHSYAMQALEGAWVCMPCLLRSGIRVCL
jgi:integrase/recombinase XerD